jgi:hypothetical protein
MQLITKVKYLRKDTELTLELKWHEIKRYACTVLVICGKLRNQVDGVVVTFWKCLDLISDGTMTILPLFMVLYSPSRQMALHCQMVTYHYYLKVSQYLREQEMSESKPVDSH